MSSKLELPHFVSAEGAAQKDGGGGGRDASHLPGRQSGEMSFDLWGMNPALKRQLPLNMRALSASVPSPTSVPRTCIPRGSAQAPASHEAGPASSDRSFPCVISHSCLQVLYPSILWPRRTMGLRKGERALVWSQGPGSFVI